MFSHPTTKPPGSPDVNILFFALCKLENASDSPENGCRDPWHASVRGAAEQPVLLHVLGLEWHAKISLASPGNLLFAISMHAGSSWTFEQDPAARTATPLLWCLDGHFSRRRHHSLGLFQHVPYNSRHVDAYSLHPEVWQASLPAMGRWPPTVTILPSQLPRDCPSNC